MGLNPKKGALLGHKVSQKGVEADLEKKLKKIVAKGAPKSQTELKSFLASAQYYKRQYLGFATTTKPLFTLTKKDEAREGFEWTAESQAAFEAIKVEMLKAVMVQAPRWEDPFCLSIMVTNSTFEFDLYQLKEAGGKLLRPVYFSNRLMKEAEQKYTLLEKHVACLLAGVRKFHHYLVGTKKFKVMTTYMILTHLMTLSEPTGRIGNWLKNLMGYDFEIIAKGITFKKVEAGLTCYEARDITRLLGFGSGGEDVESETSPEALARELDSQKKRLLKAKTASNSTEEWLE